MAEFPTGRLFLAGSWIDTAERMEIRNPWTDDVTGVACQASERELETATAAADGAAAVFRKSKRHERAAICRRISEGIKARGEEFAALITAESGKPIMYARGEVSRAVVTFALGAEEANRFTVEVLPLDISAASENLSGFSYRLGLGPVAAISPFNFPLNLVAHKIAPALAVGCPVVLKPAPQTPLTALLLAEVIEDAGAPAGAVSVLPMANDTAEKMVRDDRFRVLSFTGSAAVGWHLKSISGRKRVLLELGGNAPAIVHSDADIKHAVERLVAGSFAAAGQVCIKAQRLLLHRDVYDRFLEAFVAATKEVKVGDPADAETVVGPLIDEKAAARVEAWVQESVDLGAKILCGGKREGKVFYPTVLANVPREAKCLTEEIFGPVVTVEAYSDFEDAVARANDTVYGLQAAVFSFDSRVIDEAVESLDYGGIIVNDSPMVRVDNYPYGGTKQSGLGREGVRYAMEEFSEPKVVVTRRHVGDNG